MEKNRLAFDPFLPQADTRRYEHAKREADYYLKIGRELDAQMKLHKMDFDEVMTTMERYANFRDTFGPK